tara:strand:- start:70 stop:306 length:237 start_codon:yes stop_codon:yes gene_type:complete
MKTELIGIIKTLSFMFGLLALLMLLVEILIIAAIGVNTLTFLRMLSWTLIAFFGFKCSSAFAWYVEKKVNEKIRRQFK